jgi:hypothetical protein
MAIFLHVPRFSSNSNPQDSCIASTRQNFSPSGEVKKDVDIIIARIVAKSF